MSDGLNHLTPQRPASEGFATWPDYWQVQGMPWRTEPEIDKERQTYLAERRAVTPDIAQGIYPFRDENGSIKLTRADVEWLLATHESGGYKGPVDWSDPKQRAREGLDLRGADLRGINVRDLPLAKLRGGLSRDDWHVAPTLHREMAAVHMEETLASRVHLEGAELRTTHFEQADIEGAHLEAANLRDAHFQGADLRRAFFDFDTVLNEVALTDRLYGGAWLADVRWNGANLAVVDWSRFGMLGDEQVARKVQRGKEGLEDDRTRPIDFGTAVRAYRQVGTELRRQGLNESADRLAYRAQLCQRVVLRRQHRYLHYLGSLFLDLIAGYGYRPLRSLFAYILMVGGFAIAYYLLGANVNPALSAHDAIVFSITSFHGRGFSPGANITLHNPLTTLAAAEAIIGLLIEITFIATFTQRFFAR